MILELPAGRRVDLGERVVVLARVGLDVSGSDGSVGRDPFAGPPVPGAVPATTTALHDGAFGVCLEARGLVLRRAARPDSDVDALVEVIGRLGDVAAVIVGTDDPVVASRALDAGADGVRVEGTLEDDVLALAATRGALAWITVDGSQSATLVRDRARSAGLPPQRLVVEVPLDAVSEVSDAELAIACVPESRGAIAGGSLEAEVVNAVVAGARVICSREVRVARRCADVTIALLTEHTGGHVHTSAATAS